MRERPCMSKNLAFIANAGTYFDKRTSAVENPVQPLGAHCGLPALSKAAGRRAKAERHSLPRIV